MEENKITSFRGDYFFLSNFYPCAILYNGYLFGSAEAAFQAQKVINSRDQVSFTQMSPGQAKKYGKTVELRKDWEDVKLGIMEDIIREKFIYDPDLIKMLLDTGDKELIEGNNWNDTFWGMCRGKGENHLGKILMKLREELRMKEVAT